MELGKEDTANLHYHFVCIQPNPTINQPMASNLETANQPSILPVNQIVAHLLPDVQISLRVSGVVARQEIAR